MTSSLPLIFRRAGGRVAGAGLGVLAAVLAGCVTPPPPPGTPLGTHPLAIFQSGVARAGSGKTVQRPSPQTVGPVQQRETFATLETYVTLLARSNALDNTTCGQASEAAARELRTMPPSEPALRLALIAGCPAASADAVRLAVEELGKFAEPVEGEQAGVEVPAPIAALAQVRQSELQRRLTLVGRVTRDRASVSERDEQVAALLEQAERVDAERQEERRAARRLRERLRSELELTRESLAEAREKLDAVSRIERAVQQAGEAVDVQGGWAEMAPPSAGTADEAPAANEAPAAAERPAASGARARRPVRGGALDEQLSPAAPTTEEQS